jgi:hypothetical protein
LQLLIFSPQPPKTVISTEGGALAAAVEKSAVVFAVVCFFARPPKTVISTEGGALAAAAEKSAV